MDVYGCLWMFMDVYGCLWMFMDVYGCLWHFKRRMCFANVRALMYALFPVLFPQNSVKYVPLHSNEQVAELL